MFQGPRLVVGRGSIETLLSPSQVGGTGGDEIEVGQPAQLQLTFDS